MNSLVPIVEGLAARLPAPRVIYDSRHYTRRSWEAMLARCYVETNASYKYYGAKDITVCDSWRASFDAFLLDMGLRPHGCTIDRINGAGNYEPLNCRWASIKEQNRNLSSNFIVLFRDTEMCLAALSDVTGISYETLRARIKRLGWSVEKAATTPSRVYSRGDERYAIKHGRKIRQKPRAT